MLFPKSWKGFGGGRNKSHQASAGLNAAYVVDHGMVDNCVQRGIVLSAGYDGRQEMLIDRESVLSTAS
eukprot:5049590-Ditylum_brightwellii.AAC.1